MRKLYVVVSIAIMLAGFLSACEQNDPVVIDVPGHSPTLAFRTISPPSSPCGDATFNLLAGKTIPAGMVSVANDEDSLYVTFETTDGWAMTVTHLAVASSPEELPGNNGHLVPGLFPMSALHDPATVSTCYSVPLSVLQGSDVAAIAAHAGVVKGSENEGAWAEGTSAGGKGWSMYLSYELADCGESVVVEVGPDGGEVPFPGGNLSVDDGALSETVEIVVTPVPDEDLPPSVLPGTAFDFGPDGLVFDPPAMLLLNYDDTGLTLPQEEGLAIYSLEGNTLTALPSVVDVVANTISAAVSHFSVYAIPTPVGTLNLVFPDSTGEGGTITHTVEFLNLTDGTLADPVTVELTVTGPVSAGSYPPDCTMDSPVAGTFHYACTRTNVPATLWQTVIEHNVDPASAGLEVMAFASYSYESPTGEILTGTTETAITPITAPLPEVDLGVSINPPVAPTTAAPIQFSVLVSNATVSYVESAHFTVEVTNVPSADVALVSVSPDNGCIANTVPGGIFVDCPVGGIGGGQVIEFIVTITVGTSGPLLINASVYDDYTTDPFSENDNASESTWVN